MDILQEILNAERRTEPHLLVTPLLYSHYLSDLCDGEVYLKMESEQYTGSFKARGAINKLTWLLERKQASKTIITASTGNHGLGVARALNSLKMEGRIVVPENADENKVDALQQFGAEIEVYGKDCFESEIYAREKARKEDMVYVSPYNDPQVIGGQGTIGTEISRQLGYPIDNVLVTIGGGGLISGIGTYFKAVNPNIRVLGCQPKNSPEMTLSVRSGSYQTVEQQETLSDASAGPFEQDSITYPLCKELVDDFFLATEQQIASAIHLVLKRERKLIEGAAAVAVACFLKNIDRFREQTSVIVICGGNISEKNLRKVICS
ncbi:MAG: threonine/serine dehydratase [Saprospiraceae bacterium]|nr:threonine/serine dehydratase [Saprospiraceae bacterium]